MTEVSQISRCEVCGSPDLLPVLDLGQQPLCDDLIPIGDLGICNKYHIDIVYCQQCSTAHQNYQVEKHTLFPQSYHYRSRFTKDVLSGMDDLVSRVVENLEDCSGLKVLDIGCNDGSLLDKFQDYGFNTYGVEPTGAVSDALNKGHVVINSYFNELLATKLHEQYGYMDVITFTNVFAHIEDLSALLTAVKRLMSPTTKLVVENHYLGKVLELNQFDTFYHEHPRTYSLGSFLEIAANLECQIVGLEFPSRYGGNIRVTMSQKLEDNDPHIDELIVSTLRKKSFLDDFCRMNDFMNEWKISKFSELQKLANKYGPLPAKAFPGRSAILIELLGLDTSIIKCVYEKPGSKKIGNYIPGTRIPILSDEELFSSSKEPPVIVNLAWHISTEIKSYLVANNIRSSVVNIL